jgi:hypothetical protein
VDSEHFDDIVRSLLSATSRRGVLATLCGGLVMSRFSALYDDEAIAKKKKKKKKKKKSPPPIPPPSPPSPPVSLPPPPPPPNFLDICGIGFETCGNSSDGCCVAGQNCCPTAGTGINGCCGFNQTCAGPNLCNPICTGSTDNRPCPNQDQCCSAQYPECCPDNGGCCSAGFTVCCSTFCCRSGFHCGTSGCVADSSSGSTTSQAQEIPGAPMMKYGRHRKETHRGASHR